jgi:tetratricopeptide (TPR) repeat protein/transcriptional regulator with XRE-family HTH domain
MGASRGTLNGWLRVCRIGAGLTQEQLAEISGISVRTISDIECGRTARPRRSSVALLEAALGGLGLDASPRQGGGPPLGHGSDLASAPAVPRQLPHAVSDFVGRERELELLTDHARTADGLVCAVTGTAGVGKTALAVRWAREVSGSFPDGQLFVNLRGYDPGQPVPAADALAGFLRAVGVPGRDIPSGSDERAALYRSLLSGRRMLVMLDNAGSAEQVRPLLPGAPGCVTLVTSRDALPGLVARDGATRVDLARLPLTDAVSLLGALLGPRTDADPVAAEALAVECSRLPLALRVAAELAAAYPVMTVADLARELADEQRRLDLLDAGGDPRAGVSAVFSWSYRLLDLASARAFRLLGLDPSAEFDCYAVAALTGTPLEDARHLLDRLARTHLVERTRPDRAGMHDLLRGYARRLAAEDTEAEQRAALTRLFDHYLHTAARAMNTLFPAERHRRPAIPSPASPVPPVTEPVSARAWLDAERAALTAIAAYMVGNGWPGHTIRLSRTLFRYLEVGGHYPEIRTIHGYAHRAARDTADRAAEAQIAHDLAVVDLHLGRYQQAIVLIQRARRLCREEGDQIGQARALSNLGIARLQQGHYRPAITSLRRALTLYRQAGDLFGEARALNNLGLIELRQGRYQLAGRRLDSALALHRQIGDQANETNCLANLGVVELRQGRREQAAAWLEQALLLSQQIGEPISEAYSLANLGIVNLRQGRHQQAVSRLRQALTLSRECGERSVEAEALNGLGEAQLVAGRPGDSRTEHATALSLACQIGELYEQARAHYGLAASYRATGDTRRALRHWQQALALYARLACPEADDVRSQLTAAGRVPAPHDI